MSKTGKFSSVGRSCPVTSQLMLLPVSFLLNYNLSHCDFLPEYGDGYCRIFNINEFASILLIEVCLLKELCLQISCKNFDVISYYDLLDAHLHHPDGTTELLHAHRLYMHAFNNTKTPETIFHAGRKQRGMILVFSPEEYHKYLSAHMPESLRDDIDSGLDRLYTVNEINLPGISAVCNQIRSFSGNGLAAQLYAESKFNELISLALQNCQDNHQSAGDTRSHRIKTEDLPHISAVKQHLATHLEGPINMANLARMACMSQSKLKYCFREATGFSVSDWRQNLRMQTARELLLTTRLPIYEIAARAGYRKAGSFSEAFTRSEGVSPSEKRGTRYLYEFVTALILL